MPQVIFEISKIIWTRGIVISELDVSCLGPYAAAPFLLALADFSSDFFRIGVPL